MPAAGSDENPHAEALRGAEESGDAVTAGLGDQEQSGAGRVGHANRWMGWMRWMFGRALPSQWGRQRPGGSVAIGRF